MHGHAVDERQAEDERLRADSARLEALLEQVRGMAGPATWPRIEELVHRLVSLYGAGLARVLGHVRDTGAMSEALTNRLARDELVSSLLLLHGLHPLPMEARVRRALDDVRPYLGSHAGDVEVTGIQPDGVVRLRLLGSCNGCPSSRATVQHTLRRAIEDAAPEVTAVEVEGLAAERVHPLHKSSPPPQQHWQLVPKDELPAQGERRVVDADGVPVLIAGLNGAFVAYRDRCGTCGTSLEGAAMAEGQLACSCGRTYDLARAGRVIAGEGPPLDPIPLLPFGKAARIAVPPVGGTP